MTKTALDAAADFLEYDAGRHDQQHDGLGLDRCRVGPLMLSRKEVAPLLRAKAIEQRIDGAVIAMQKG